MPGARQLGRHIGRPDHLWLAVDYRLYMDAVARWLAAGPYFEAHQLAGPYTITPGDILYPPTTLPLFVAFTVLPAPLWWSIPLVGTAAIVTWQRPSWPALAGIAAEHATLG